MPGLAFCDALSLGCDGNVAVVSNANALLVIDLDGTAQKSLPHQQARG